MGEIVNQVMLRQLTVIISLLVGLAVVYLGYKLLVLGITGKFSLKSDLNGFKADLVSASPGTLFVLVGGFIILKSLDHKIEFTTNAKSTEVFPKGITSVTFHATDQITGKGSIEASIKKCEQETLQNIKMLMNGSSAIYPVCIPFSAPQGE